MYFFFLPATYPSAPLQIRCHGRVGTTFFQMPCLISSFPSVQFLLQYNKPWALSTSLCVYIRSSTLFVSVTTSGENISALFHLTTAVKVSKTVVLSLSNGFDEVVILVIKKSQLPPPQEL